MSGSRPLEPTFDFARQLRDPQFRAYLQSAGYVSGTPAVVLAVHESWPAALDIARANSTPLPVFAARRDARFPHGWELRLLHGSADTGTGPAFCPTAPGCGDLGRCAGFCRSPDILVTRTGTVLTESDLDDLAQEAERGYDPDKLVPRPSNPENRSE